MRQISTNWRLKPLPVLMASGYLNLWCKERLDMRGEGRFRSYLYKLALSVTRLEGAILKQ